MIQTANTSQHVEFFHSLIFYAYCSCCSESDANNMKMLGWEAGVKGSRGIGGKGGGVGASVDTFWTVG